MATASGPAYPVTHNLCAVAICKVVHVPARLRGTARAPKEGCRITHTLSSSNITLGLSFYKIRIPAAARAKLACNLPPPPRTKPCHEIRAPGHNLAKANVPAPALKIPTQGTPHVLLDNNN